MRDVRPNEEGRMISLQSQSLLRSKTVSENDTKSLSPRLLPVQLSALKPIHKADYADSQQGEYYQKSHHAVDVKS